MKSTLKNNHSHTPKHPLESAKYSNNWLPSIFRIRKKRISTLLKKISMLHVASPLQFIDKGKKKTKKREF